MLARTRQLLQVSFWLTPILLVGQDTAPFNQLEMRMKSTEVEIVYASPEDAAQAELKIASLPNHKSWAFSTRWDDNNLKHLRMRDLMAKYGYKGGFYLNNGLGLASAEFAK